MLIDQLKKLSQGNQPQTLNELFDSSKEGLLFERLNKSLQDAVLRFKEQIKKELSNLISQIIKEELSGISVEELKKNANVLMEDVKNELENMSSKLIEDAVSSASSAKNLKEIAFVIKDNAIKSLEKDISVVVKNSQEAMKVSKEDTKKENKELLDIKTEFENLKNNLPNLIRSLIPRAGKGGGGSTIKVDNLSNQITGSTRSFTTTHKIGQEHLLLYSSAPTLFLPTTDYSASGYSVTLDSSIDFPISGQSLAIIYERAD